MYTDWGRRVGPSFVGFFCAVTTLFSFAVASAAPEAYLKIESFSHADPVSVHSYVKSWDGRLESGSDAVTHNWIESGACYGRVCAALLHRLDYEVKANHDTAELYYLAHNRRDLDTGRVYDLDLRVWHQRSRGLRLAYRDTPHIGLSLEYGISLLQAQVFTDGRLTGSSRVSGPKNYDYDLQVDYFYSEDGLFERDVPLPAGKGMSLDISVAWRINERFFVYTQVRDLYGYLKWDRAPFTTATATSATKTFGEDGYVNYSPTITGVEGNRDYRQRLHPRALLGVDYQWSQDNTIGLHLRLTEVKTYASLRAARQYPGCLAFNAELMPLQRALGVGLSCGLLSFSLMSDSLRFEDAHLLQMNVMLAYDF